MKKFILVVVYAIIISIPLMLLKTFLGFDDSWWIHLIIINLGLFLGSFFFTQFHGNQVMELKHLGSLEETHRFQVTIKVSGFGYLNIVGHYLRVNSYSDLVLQGKIFKTLNSFPSNKWIKDFAHDKNEKNITINVPDYDRPHPLNFTMVKLEKYENETEKSLKDLEKEIKGMSKYEVEMKLWQQEQELLDKAKKDGLEDQLIAYWESIGKPKMKEPPKREG